MLITERIGQSDGITAAVWTHIAPPHPRRHLCHTAQFQNTIGCATGIVSVVLIAKWMGASKPVILSLVAKSVTTPIAMEVTSTLGGIPSLTAAIVVAVGILGAIIGFRVLHFGRFKHADSQGLSIGTASHAVGTSAAMQRGEEQGAFASLGLILNGVFTAVLASFLLSWTGIV